MIGMTLCSGIGAPEMAAPWVDWRFASEIDPFAREVLKQRFDYKTPADQNQGEALLWGDMTEVTPELLRERGIPLPDLIVAGTPCQAFSIAGLRKGVEDERGNLTLKFVEICHAIVDARSDGKLVVLWENVPGVLSDNGNAFGNFLGGLVGADDALCHPTGESWPSEGMVEGPRSRCAWRVLDAQYFGLAQRRKRVFVVVDFGNAVDPAEVLFERQGLQGNPAPSRETREGAAGGSGSGASHWSGGPHPSLNQSHNTGGIGASNQEIFSQQGAGIVEATHDVAGTMLSRKTSGGFSNSIDHAAGEYMAIHHDIAGPLTAGMHKGPRGTEAAEGNHIIPASWPAQIAPTLNAAFGDKQGLEDQHALNGAGLFVPVAFDSKGSEVQTDETGVSPPLRAMGHNNSHKNGGGHAAVVFEPRYYTRGQGSAKDYKAREVEVCQPLMAGGPVGGNQGGDFIQRGPTVRRLMPSECAKLQGFPPDHCAITYRGKPAADGPQYKSYGNSMAVKTSNGSWPVSGLRQEMTNQKRKTKMTAFEELHRRTNGQILKLARQGKLVDESFKEFSRRVYPGASEEQVRMMRVCFSQARQNLTL